MVPVCSTGDVPSDVHSLRTYRLHWSQNPQGPILNGNWNIKKRHWTQGQKTDTHTHKAFHSSPGAAECLHVWGNRMGQFGEWCRDSSWITGLISDSLSQFVHWLSGHGAEDSNAWPPEEQATGNCDSGSQEAKERKSGDVFKPFTSNKTPTKHQSGQLL